MGSVGGGIGAIGEYAVATNGGGAIPGIGMAVGMGLHGHGHGHGTHPANIQSAYWERVKSDPT